MGSTRALILSLTGILLLAASVYFLQVSEEFTDISTMIGPVTATLEPGEAYSYTFQWRVVERNPRSISGRGYLIYEAFAGPSSCSNIGFLSLSIQDSCHWTIFGVKLTNTTPASGHVNLTLVVRKPGNSYEIRAVKPREWVFITITSTEPYTTFILNTGSTPVDIEAWYGLGDHDESKPYIKLALLSATIGVVLVAASAVITAQRVLKREWGLRGVKALVEALLRINRFPREASDLTRLFIAGVLGTEVAHHLLCFNPSRVI